MECRLAEDPDECLEGPPERPEEKPEERLEELDGRLEDRLEELDERLEEEREEWLEEERLLGIVADFMSCHGAALMSCR
ncbi:hypothetical protein ACTNE3_04580 [Bacillota bacterium HCP3S3_F1_1]